MLKGEGSHSFVNCRFVRERNARKKHENEKSIHGSSSSCYHFRKFLVISRFSVASSFLLSRGHLIHGNDVNIIKSDPFPDYSIGDVCASIRDCHHRRRSSHQAADFRRRSSSRKESRSYP